MDENGDEITQELHFFYDAQSKPAFVEFEDMKYRYIYNLQGDIIGIVDVAGNSMVEYEYDGWGRILSIVGILKDSLGYLNPFRYRGYVLDDESSMYYLKTRYYVWESGRFLNADTIILSKSILDGNLFTYCYNTPISFVDKNGMSPTIMPQPSRPLDWDKAYTPDPWKQPIAIDIPKNKKSSVLTRVSNFLKSLVGWALYVENDDKEQIRTIWGGTTVGRNVSYQLAGNTTGKKVIGYAKLVDWKLNWGVSMGNFFVEMGENGLTLSGGNDSQSYYINISDNIYLGSSANKEMNGNTTISSYEESYVNLLILAVAVVGAVNGVDFSGALSAGFVF